MSIPATMRVSRQTSLNGPQDMRLITDVPVPSPGQGEVLIRVTAAGVNFADISKAHGMFPDGPRPPYLAGFEAAGEVVAMGEAVTGPQPGTRVTGVGTALSPSTWCCPRPRRCQCPRLDGAAGARPGRELAHRAGRTQAFG
jgi:NADPH:quinone reductase-like Zn-dependent oxidoreductase